MIGYAAGVSELITSKVSVEFITPKALANPSPGLARQRLPWDKVSQ